MSSLAPAYSLGVMADGEVSSEQGLTNDTGSPLKINSAVTNKSDVGVAGKLGVTGSSLFTGNSVFNGTINLAGVLTTASPIQASNNVNILGVTSGNGPTLQLQASGASAFYVGQAQAADGIGVNDFFIYNQHLNNFTVKQDYATGVWLWNTVSQFPTFATTATNWGTITATGFVNNTGTNVILSISGTGNLVWHDASGQTWATNGATVSGLMYPGLQPGGSVTGSGLSGTWHVQ